MCRHPLCGSWSSWPFFFDTRKGAMKKGLNCPDSCHQKKASASLWSSVWSTTASCQTVLLLIHRVWHSLIDARFWIDCLDWDVCTTSWTSLCWTFVSWLLCSEILVIHSSHLFLHSIWVLSSSHISSSLISLFSCLSTDRHWGKRVWWLADLASPSFVPLTFSVRMINYEHVIRG